MLDMFKKKTEYLFAPFAGKIVKLQDLNDEAFAKKILGDGIAVDPEENIVKSPCAGEVVQVFTTGHALGIQTDLGLEVLVHIGINTIKLNGKGFTKKIKNGDRVEVGTPLIEIDLEYIKENADAISTPLVITNMDKVKNIKILKNENVEAGEKIIEVELY
ncbi:PTS sugar transporter subunit IIA [Halanaerobium hydrogeniformans]|uniref:PTS system, glucose subfamily, IIA subunit n=1 Tax=Halanaerobium hydrogeniformans TaxID=656519 RepID=E4RJ59_HALHG|nr:PTS glucose transporter subunit IIA [Halanaerobium hydrogeniformans]ADQ15279.1 PTS system, glucose subfamily, IIA subunit [Halanaerobium hydrogeniformans]